MIYKRIAAAVLCLLILFALCACKKADFRCADVLDHFAAQRQNAVTLYDLDGKKGAKPESAMLARLYGKSEPPAQFSAIADGALLLSKNEDGYEIELYRPSHPSEAERIKGLLYMRLQTLQSAEMRRYMVEDYERYIASAGIYEIEGALCLLATGDNDQTAALISELMKAE